MSGDVNFSVQVDSCFHNGNLQMNAELVSLVRLIVRTMPFSDAIADEGESQNNTDD